MRTLNLPNRNIIIILTIGTRMNNLNTTHWTKTPLSINSRHIIPILTILRIRMHLLKPLHHLLPRRPNNTLDIQLLPRRKAVTTVLFDPGDGDTKGFGGNDICAAAGEEEGGE